MYVCVWGGGGEGVQGCVNVCVGGRRVQVCVCVCACVCVCVGGTVSVGGERDSVGGGGSGGREGGSFLFSFLQGVGGVGG